MQILILGATGRTGELLLIEALKRGHKVAVLVSHKGNLRVKDERIIVYEGTPLNRFTLNDAMQDCDAILSTLNVSRVSDFPWAKLRTSKDFLSSSLTSVLLTAPKHNINRIILTTAWGVGETREDIPFWFDWLIENSNIRYPYMEHELQEQILQQSNINWTVVRPVMLTDSVNNKKVVVSFNNRPRPSLFISRQNVANFMLDVLEGDLYKQQLPVISEK